MRTFDKRDYEEVVESMKKLAKEKGHDISEEDAVEAANNLIAFGKIALEIREEQLRANNKSV